ncbi:dTDP-4-dehydrorhamnose 3,5-epimerase [Aminipila terrae]|uniref:dTDP-4-dehydrorhamnose 3,5-epimerase n=1 Tax=Aminipila terrae TaxID=2697030 RepID=A0A6P1MLT9_9FIRM|nr:dTDP-4-dehydrorhamnose 3,5-epimerase [Aminipila terrae]QHI71955.1 dTDP-4-dehydrorhamnose 3,5-epimerase [Aminipila terrae]
MKILDTLFQGLKVIEMEPHMDNRGSFARAYCEEEFKEAGIDCHFVQDNISYNYKKNTIRGMHWQQEPYGEDKLIRCISGAVYDVVVDMRSGSKTYLKWYGLELTEENQKALFIPKGFAHGYQALEENSTVYYKVSQNYHPESAVGIRHDDRKININWRDLGCEKIMSEQDKKWELL